jgi:hypothetical protein
MPQRQGDWQGSCFIRSWRKVAAASVDPKVGRGDRVRVGDGAGEGVRVAVAVGAVAGVIVTAGVGDDVGVAVGAAAGPAQAASRTETGRSANNAKGFIGMHILRISPSRVRCYLSRTLSDASTLAAPAGAGVRLRAATLKRRRSFTWPYQACLSWPISVSTGTRAPFAAAARTPSHRTKAACCPQSSAGRRGKGTAPPRPFL